MSIHIYPVQRPTPPVDQAMFPQLSRVEVLFEGPRSRAMMRALVGVMEAHGVIVNQTVENGPAVGQETGYFAGRITPEAAASICAKR